MDNLRAQDSLIPQYDKMRLDQELAFKRFKMFFAGLIFAVLSYLGTNIKPHDSIFLKFLIIISMFSLLISGMTLLLQLYHLAYIPKKNVILRPKFVDAINFYHKYVLESSWFIWSPFLIGMFSITIVWCFQI